MTLIILVSVASFAVGLFVGAKTGLYFAAKGLVRKYPDLALLIAKKRGSR